MKILSDILGAATGGLLREVKDLVTTYWPPDLSPEKRAQLEAALEDRIAAREKAASDATAEASRLINERVALYEGTASDLKSIPILGSLMLFLRGAQRPTWGYAALYMDWQWFTVWTELGSQQQAALYIINFLVLGFLFGERAVQNVAPLIAEVFRAKTGRG